MVPIAATGQSCQCAAAPVIAPGSPVQHPAPEIAAETPPLAAPLPSAPASSSTTTDQAPAPDSRVEVGVLARASDVQPSAPPENQQAAAAPPPPDSTQVYEIIPPPLSFSSTSPSPTNAPTDQTALVIREIHADPDWEFTGHVETPDFAQAMNGALGLGNPAAQPAVPPPAEKKPRGFWHLMKKIFIGDAR
ncbi:MAG TPA: hypothetical protein VGH65_09095, partial [Verrucomicrobiaceae bacterium]|jgi:hypothetical protein